LTSFCILVLQPEGAYNCAGDAMITLQGLVEQMGKIMGEKPKLKFNLNTDGDKFNESEFPFANENFICSNSKIKKMGIKFMPLVEGLEQDYFNYYKDKII